MQRNAAPIHKDRPQTSLITHPFRGPVPQCPTSVVDSCIFSQSSYYSRHHRYQLFASVKVRCSQDFEIGL